MKDTGPRDQKNWHLFFRHLGVICRFSINIRIEVHFFFVCIGKWKDTGRIGKWKDTGRV